MNSLKEALDWFFMRNVLTVGDLKKILKEYPDDVRIALGVEPDDELGLYYRVDVTGIDTGNDKILCLSSKDLSLDVSFFRNEVLKNGDY